ncbi:hypothetical protein JCM15908A_04690 [Prevotella dentasini JCM 15908]
MEDGHRIVHHAKRIDHRAKTFFAESPADIVSKARANKQHPFAGMQFKRRAWQIDYGSEIHSYKVNKK